MTFHFPLFSRSLTLTPSFNDPMASSSSWVSNLEQAIVLLGQKNYDEAFRAFDKVSKSSSLSFELAPPPSSLLSTAH